MSNTTRRIACGLAALTWVVVSGCIGQITPEGDPAPLTNGSRDGERVVLGNQKCTTCVCGYGPCVYNHDCPSGALCKAVGGGGKQCVKQDVAGDCGAGDSCTAPGTQCVDIPGVGKKCAKDGAHLDNTFKDACTAWVKQQQGCRSTQVTPWPAAGGSYDHRGCDTMRIEEKGHGSSGMCTAFVDRIFSCVSEGCPNVTACSTSCSLFGNKTQADQAIHDCQNQLDQLGLGYNVVLTANQTLNGGCTRTTHRTYECRKGSTNVTHEKCDESKACYWIAHGTIDCDDNGKLVKATCCPSASGDPRWVIGTSCPTRSCADLVASGTCWGGSGKTTVACSGGSGQVSCCSRATGQTVGWIEAGSWRAQCERKCDPAAPNACGDPNSTCSAATRTCKTCPSGKLNCDGVGDCECNVGCDGTHCRTLTQPGTGGGGSSAGPDADNDGVPDALDQCSRTPAGATVHTSGTYTGCSGGQYRDADDSDRDGVPNSQDACPGTPYGAAVGSNGCVQSSSGGSSSGGSSSGGSSSGGSDTDRDGIADSQDACSNTPYGATVHTSGTYIGCSGGQYRDVDDRDRDGVPNSRDACPATPIGAPVGADGCSGSGGGSSGSAGTSGSDADGDGIPDSLDRCDNTPSYWRSGVLTSGDYIGCYPNGDTITDSGGSSGSGSSGSGGGSGTSGSAGDADGDGIPDSEDRCDQTPSYWRSGVLTSGDYRGCYPNGDIVTG